MNIETLLAELTAAIRANTEALTGGVGKKSAPAQDAAEAETAAPAKKTRAPRKSAAATTDDEDEAPATKKPVKKSSVTLDDLQNLAKTFQQHTDDANERKARLKEIQKLLGEFGATSLSGKGDTVALDEEHYPAFKKKLEAKIAALADDGDDEDGDDEDL